MYESYFSLSSRPFDLAPDPKFLFSTEQHSRAVSNVVFALMNHDSFVVISGEIGTGKTTVLNAALGQLGTQYVTARLVHTTLSDVELLQSLLSEFGAPNYQTRRVELLDQLKRHFLEQHQAGRHVVIIVDEAQHLTPASLEELRLLSCIDSQDRRIVTIVLMGHPALDDVLDDPGLEQLRQRTRLRQRLRPLTQTDTTDYIRHRIKVAGGNADEMFLPETMTRIHALTSGVPRLINTLCDTALTACFIDNKQAVELETLSVVVNELGWRWGDAGDSKSRQEPRRHDTEPGAAGRVLLDVFIGGRHVDQVVVRSLPFSVGRDVGNGLVLEEIGISRRHALLDLVQEHLVITDLNSRNGMLVNGTRVGTARLQTGDVVTLGYAKLVVQVGDSAGRAGSADDTGRHQTSQILER